MNDMLLHVAMDAPMETSPWRPVMAEQGIVVYLAKSRPEAMYYHQSYPMTAVLLEVDGRDAGALEEFIGQLRTLAPAQGCPPILALTHGEPSLELMNDWIARGATDLMSQAAPGSANIARLLALRDQAVLRRNVDPANSPAELARQTRRHLHDLSQPLSAVQGKLQLLVIKTQPDDPNHEVYKELVGLIQRVTAELMEVHQIQRKMS